MPVDATSLAEELDSGNAAFGSGDYRRALHHFERALTVAPDRSEIWRQYDYARGLAPAFDQCLLEKDRGSPRNRIFILGCGRSGTTLLLGLMTCFRDTYVLVDEAAAGGEDSFGRFARIDRSERTHVIKRDGGAFQFCHLIPRSIGLLYLIRHPLDVFVSTLKLDREYRYYIDTARWNHEIDALRRLVTQYRTNMLIVRYEDLVTGPDCVQTRLAEFFDLEPQGPFSRYSELFSAGDIIAQSMNGIRPVDRDSIGKWSSKSAHIAHCRSIWAEVESNLRWVCDAFGYDRSAIIRGLGI